MRTLDTQQIGQVSGGKISVEVNVPAKYVHVNLVTPFKTITLVNVDWSKFGKGGAATGDA